MIYDLLVYIALYFILISGSALGAVLGGKRFHSTLPLTALALIMFLYIGGLLGRLADFASAAIILCLAVFLLSVILAIALRRWRAFSSAFFTPAFWIFTALFFAICLSTRGMRPSTWDEFSHWADCVKAMYTLGDFCTNPLSYSQYKAYPPAMALFQYFFTVARDAFGSSPRFDEGLLYAAYQTLCCCLIVPFLGGLRRKAWPVALLAGVAALTLPAVYFRNYFESVYIDCFLGVMGGFTFAYIYLGKWRKPLGMAVLILAEAALVLTKDSGLLFAVLSAAYAVCDALVSLRYKEGKEKNKALSALLPAAFVCLSIAAAKLSWNMELQRNGLAATTMRIDLPGFFRLVMGKSAGDYRAQIIPAFLRAVFLTPSILNNVGLNAVLLIAALTALPRVSTDKAARARKRLLVCFSVALAIIYLLGLLMLYLYRLPAYEGLRLSSFKRYAGTLSAAMLMIAAATALRALRGERPVKSVRAGVICLVMALVFLVWPLPTAFTALSGKCRETVRTDTQAYVDAAADVKDALLAFDSAGGARVQIIAQEDNGKLFWAQRYYLRGFGNALLYRGRNAFSIGEPFYEGDIWTMRLTRDEWTQILLSDYDFVLPLQVNDYFMERFSVLFREGDVEMGCLYRVTRTSEGGALLVPAI